MKKLLGILFAVLIFAAPLAMNAEIEATAGSMKVGVHMDFTYRWSGEINKNPDSDEASWKGYDTFSAGDLMIQLTGKVGDRISYKILEGLVYATFEPDFGFENRGEGPVINIWPKPMSQSCGGQQVQVATGQALTDSVGGCCCGLVTAPLEAYVDFQAMDKLKVRVGKTVIPTLIANTGVHQADVIHTANPPLIADRIMGINEIVLGLELPAFPRIWLPLSVTGMGVIGNPIEGLELEFFVYDEWALGTDELTGAPWGDLGYDFNRTKGWDLAGTYNRDVFSGNLTLRAFYFSEYLDFTNLDVNLPNGRNSGWGVGAVFDAPRWFAGAEYTQDTIHYVDDPLPWVDKKNNTWKGYYIQGGLKFGAIQPVARFDWIDYTSLRNGDVHSSTDIAITTADNELWYTLGVNWLVNDNATVGLNYVMKRPETPKVFGGTMNNLDVNELVVMFELDLL